MFGSTKCGKCESASFKIQEISPSGANYKMFAIQCGSCQTPIGVTDYYSTGALLKQQEKTLDDLKSMISGMAQQLNQIAHFLNQTRR
jgi:predicted nucleic-acid-binding Zn-ribbon protein